MLATFPYHSSLIGFSFCSPFPSGEGAGGRGPAPLGTVRAIVGPVMPRSVQGDVVFVGATLVVARFLGLPPPLPLGEGAGG